MYVKTGHCAFTLGKKKRFSSVYTSTSYKVPTDISTMCLKRTTKAAVMQI